MARSRLCEARVATTARVFPTFPTGFAATLLACFLIDATIEIHPARACAPWLLILGLTLSTRLGSTYGWKEVAALACESDCRRQSAPARQAYM